MLPFLREHHADPGRLHAEGHVTRIAIEEARESVAALFGTRPREVVFTSSGTEAVNTAVWGAIARHGGGHVVTTAVEHSAVLEACARASGTSITAVGVDRAGRFDAREVLDAIRPDTALVSVQLANHEVGTLQPAAEIAAGARERGVVVHVDACAAAGHARGRLRRIGRRPLLGHRAQVRWPEGHRAHCSCVEACDSLRSCSAALRSAHAPRRHRRRTRDRRIRGRGRGVVGWRAGT